MHDNFFLNEHDYNLLLHELRETPPEKEELKQIFMCIDNTSLNGSDTPSSIRSFCYNTLEMCQKTNMYVAAVCVYPIFVELAKRIFENTPVRVASVSGGFPSGQTSINVKKQEIRYALEQGADEIDFVINRGAFLEGNYSALCDEVAAAKELCREKILKVILETGELSSPQNIYTASLLALHSGADIIKTSTGKIETGATPKAAYVMLSAINEFYKNNKKYSGFKAAGGISSIQDALMYYRMTKKILYYKSIDSHNFRIGTSRLTAEILKNLTEP